MRLVAERIDRKRVLEQIVDYFIKSRLVVILPAFARFFEILAVRFVILVARRRNFFAFQPGINVSLPVQVVIKIGCKFVGSLGATSKIRIELLCLKNDFARRNGSFSFGKYGFSRFGKKVGRYVINVVVVFGGIDTERKAVLP